MKKPNYFILEFPICETTSVNENIRKYPNGFTAQEKLPYYYQDYRGLDYKDYYSLFDTITDQHKIVNEVTECFLY